MACCFGRGWAFERSNPLVVSEFHRSVRDSEIASPFAIDRMNRTRRHAVRGLRPHDEAHLSLNREDTGKRGRLRLVASRNGRDGSVTVHRDVDMYATLLGEGQSVNHALRTGRAAWVQVARGTVKLNRELLYPGDGVAIEEEGVIELTGTSKDAEVLLFDMAKSHRAPSPFSVPSFGFSLIRRPSHGHAYDPRRSRCRRNRQRLTKPHYVRFFLSARTHNKWQQKDVPDDLLHQLR